MAFESSHEERKSPEAAQGNRPGPAGSAPEHDLAWPRTRSLMQDAFSEFFGVFIMVLFGDGSVAQVTLGLNKFGDYQSISWGWGLGVMLGFYVANKSGGHLNPAVTLSNCLFRRFPWRKLPVYALAQFLGGVAAAAVIYGNYRSAIDNFEGHGVRTVTGNTSTAKLFCTYPQPYMTRTGMFFSEFVDSSILILVIYSMIDSGAGPLMPLGLFFLIFGLGACFGVETGYAINLARDFGPRLVSYMAGYGTEVWSAGGYYFWIPMVAPFFGCPFGGFLYDMFLYTGTDSPINNSPYLGLPRFFRPMRSVWSNTYAKEQEYDQGSKV